VKPLGENGESCGVLCEKLLKEREMKTMPGHIVIVEDDPVTRAKLAAYFKAEGYKVSEAEDGEEMRGIVAAHPADLLLIDINLPGEDGLKLPANSASARRSGSSSSPGGATRSTASWGSRSGPTTM
jgi:PleD family two-component response regulator